MTLPLPAQKRIKSLSGNGNRGLYWNKFFDGWPSNFSDKIEPGKKLEWIGRFKAADALVDNAARIAILAGNLGGGVKKFKTAGSFVTGTGLSHPVENGFLFHHSLGVPFLPGSSIKGMIRAWAEHWTGAKGEEPEAFFRLFGRNDKEGGPSAGSIVVFDALPLKPVQLMAEIITPHIGDWRITNTPEKSPPADWVSPVPIPFLAVAPDTEFQFALAPRRASDSAEHDLATAWNYLSEALEWIGAGARTAIGFGRFESEDNRALAVGDRVEILEGDHPAKFTGRTGIITKLHTAHGGKADIKADDGKEGRIKGTFAIASLKRLASEDTKS